MTHLLAKLHDIIGPLGHPLDDFPLAIFAFFNFLSIIVSFGVFQCVNETNSRMTEIYELLLRYREQEFLPVPRSPIPAKIAKIAIVLETAAVVSLFLAWSWFAWKPGKGAKASPAIPTLSGSTASVLLFEGTGTSPGDVVAVETILNGNHLNYSAVNSSQLNAMGESQIRAYRLLIVPGGNFVDIGNNLTSDTTADIRSAVENGLNYLGICAGAFFAGNSPYNGLNLTSGVRFGFYAAESQGIRKAAVAIAGAGGPPINQYWEDGPEFTGWGAIVGKYPDATPAIVEGTFGTGWVILAGVHPEAPAYWRRGMNFMTPVSADSACAGNLIRAALDRTPLLHY